MKTHMGTDHHPWSLIKSEPIPPTQVDRPSVHTPNAPTAATPTIPEKPETLAMQTQQLATGARRVVMYTPGTAPVDYPPGVAVTHDSLGNVYLYRPDLIKKSEIHAAAKNNELPSILGSASQGMGTADKTALAPNPSTVVVRGPDGTEIQSAAADDAHIPTAIAAAHDVTPDGGAVTVERADGVIGQRMGMDSPSTSQSAGGWDIVKSEPLSTEPLADMPVSRPKGVALDRIASKPQPAGKGVIQQQSRGVQSYRVAPAPATPPADFLPAPDAMY